MAVPVRRASAVLLVVVIALLGACGHGRTADHTAAPGTPSSASSSGPSETTPSATPAPDSPSTGMSHVRHRPYSDVNPPPRRAGDFVVKVLLVTRVAPDADGHPLRPNRTGHQFWGEEVRTCLQPSGRDRAVVSWRDWSAEDVAGRVYPADPRRPQRLRTPTYPFHRVLSPGQCASGWWLITAPKGAAIRAIQFAPAGGPTLIEWPSMR